jgi:Amt family ammonium transporter
MKPHSVTLSVIGACLLWVGWFGFNAGSAVNASGLATSAFVNTHFAAAAAALGWSIGEWFRNGKPSVLGAISGAVAGLVAITPASGFVSPMPALLIGFLAGLACFFMVAIGKGKLGYDDSLDAFGVHGIGGTVGALLTGVFATNFINKGLADKSGHSPALGLVDGQCRPSPEPVLGRADLLGAGHRREPGNTEDRRRCNRSPGRQGRRDPGTRSLPARRRRVQF